MRTAWQLNARNALMRKRLSCNSDRADALTNLRPRDITLSPIAAPVKVMESQSLSLWTTHAGTRLFPAVRRQLVGPTSPVHRPKVFRSRPWPLSEPELQTLRIEHVHITRAFLPSRNHTYLDELLRGQKTALRLGRPCTCVISMSAQRLCPSPFREQQQPLQRHHLKLREKRYFLSGHA